MRSRRATGSTWSACAWTALTEEQVGELARLAPMVALALDADSGLAADVLAGDGRRGREPATR